ncbi:ribosomal protein L7/L12 [Kineosporia babensis]|uniref:Ribosomal protein L7/L12 n=1 Tax=Kineosporia babensis TaxID=499548 RepID=A0A9X1NDE2_9ACTN|nr:ribosomal protein L7/L12 [Kineosporia babensis]MCD5311719.1 ribosomal protein L7/L12 [Kineosporia babensis]
MTRQKTLVVLLNAALIMIFLTAALRGGWWLLLVLLTLSPAWRIYRVYRPGGPARVAERFTEPGRHRVVLQVAGSSPVAVVRELRRTTGLDLQASMQLIKEAPVVVRENLSESSAGLVVDHLQKAGARAVAAPIGEQ